MTSPNVLRTYFQVDVARIALLRVSTLGTWLLRRELRRFQGGLLPSKHAKGPILWAFLGRGTEANLWLSCSSHGEEVMPCGEVVRAVRFPPVPGVILALPLGLRLPSTEDSKPERDRYPQIHFWGLCLPSVLLRYFSFLSWS